MVFEKFAEMNNKYDVKNFSELIDTFDLDNEVGTIEKEVQKSLSRSKENPAFEQNMSIFDPYIYEDQNNAAYKFMAYRGHRFDLANLNQKLIIGPPLSLHQH